MTDNIEVRSAFWPSGGVTNSTLFDITEAFARPRGRFSQYRYRLRLPPLELVSTTVRSQVEQLLSRRSMSLLSDQARLELAAVVRMAENVRAALPADASPVEEALPAAEEEEVSDEHESEVYQQKPEVSDELEASGNTDNDAPSTCASEGSVESASSGGFSDTAQATDEEICWAYRAGMRDVLVEAGYSHRRIFRALDDEAGYGGSGDDGQYPRVPEAAGL